ncbi:MAG: hypothetical protein ABW196_06910 [Solirubrobacterales bacterium]
MKSGLKGLLLAGLLALALSASLPTVAPAAFNLKNFDLTFTEADGSMATQAGSHPYALNLSFEPTTVENPEGKQIPEEAIKDVIIGNPAGFIGSESPVPRCATLDFLTLRKEQGASVTECADASVVGKIAVLLGPEAEGDGNVIFAPAYLLAPAPGQAAKFGFWVEGVPVTADVGLNESSPFNLIGASRNISQFVDFYGARLTLWGNPASPLHDEERGACYKGGKSCPAGVPENAFLTLPRACTGPLSTTYEADSWLHPGAWVKGSVQTHDASGNPRGFDGCGKLPFNPSITAQPTSKAAESPTGLDFSLDVEDEGLTNPTGIAASDIRKAVVTLPEGMTANPSLAEGLEVCSEADLARERAKSAPGAGCPDVSKIGTVEVQSPLIEESLEGSVYVAEPYKNLAHDSLIALYLVIRNPTLGILVTQALEVKPDPVTGQLMTIAEDIPQTPFSHFRLRLREGARSPLISPPTCGTHEAKAVLTPWSGGPPLTTTSAFEVITGPSEGPCPKGGMPPFEPGFGAGALNNNAGSHSPFYMRLTRRDGDQDLTRFSAKLPPGMVATLAGVSQCPGSAIASAKAKTGKAEQASPSCPASSAIGRVLAGAGVGSQLTYVPGSLYLSGPFNGAPLSVVAVVPAVAGPFDVGTVVTQVALKINPRTAEVKADGSASDPIPHILAGIPLKVRDIRVYVDRENFTLNPTSCDPFQTVAELWGGGSNVFSSADDSPTTREERFQAANCANLGFKPKLDLKLKGGTKRGGHPALIGTYTPRKGDANLKNLVLRLPRSAFLDQAHIRTICTRVQFAAKSCPAGAIYGQATAYTPILEQPLSGPVYLRSSDHNLPDFVADLHGLVDVEAVARIDSAQGGIRATFEDVPDAPLTRVVVRMQGAKKGLIVNSRNLCGAKSKADVKLSGQNGKQASLRPLMEADCGKRKGKRGRGRAGGGA